MVKQIYKSFTSLKSIKPVIVVYNNPHKLYYLTKIIFDHDINHSLHRRGNTFGPFYSNITIYKIKKMQSL